MEGLGSVLGNIGSWAGSDNNWQKLLTGGMFGMGEIGNILEQRKRLAYQNFVMDLLAHPEKLAAMAAKIQKPLDNALVQGVQNRVQADMASRGLSQAPGIFAASESQALAPYQQQNADRAMNAVLSSLGLPAGTFGQPANNSGALQMFLNSFKQGGGGAGNPGGGGFTFPTDILSSLGGYSGNPATIYDTGLTPPTFGDTSTANA